MKKVLGGLIKILIFAGIVYFLYAKVEVRVYRALGTSMESSISNGELVVTIKEKNIIRGDIIVFSNEGSPAIKRIIGLPNEKIDVKIDGNIYINDKVYNETYVSTKTPKGEIVYPHTVKEDSYFILGDNRLDSYDSRYIKVDDISKKRIKGRVVFSLTNFKIIHRVYNSEE